MDEKKIRLHCELIPQHNTLRTYTNVVKGKVVPVLN
jgi:hypothetical protein